MIHEGNGNYSSEHHGWNNLIRASGRGWDWTHTHTISYEYSDDGPTCSPFANSHKIK